MRLAVIGLEGQSRMGSPTRKLLTEGDSIWEGQHPPLPAAGEHPSTHTLAAVATAERWLSWALPALIVLALALRVPLLVHAPLGDDEGEHLHAAWAITQGQVPYRDFWQSHPPLFYYLMAPVFTLMGEDLRIIYVGRGLMLLCFLLILLQLYRIARQCFDPLTGLLAVLLLSYLLLWWRPAYEFRPDIPQTLLILMSLWHFMRAWERHSRGGFLIAGALLGVAFWLLTKTLFPLVGLTLVFALSAGLRRSAAALREALVGLLLFLGAFAAAILVGGLLLWTAGALPKFLQWAVINSFRNPNRFSALPHVRLETHGAFFALALVGASLAVIRMVKARVADETQFAPLLTGAVTAAVYLFLMPAPYGQSALPFLPLAAMYGADVVRTVIARALPPQASGSAASGASANQLVRSPTRLAWAALAALLLYGVCVRPLQALLTGMPPLSDHWPRQRQTLRDVLALTSPGECVFDAYAQYIFRPHATYYYRLTIAVIRRLQAGFIPEIEIINDLRRNQCKVVISSPQLRSLPRNLLRFLYSHYVPIGFRGEVLVTGTVLPRAALAGNRATVSLIASAEYAVGAQGGAPRVTIDGQPYQAPLVLKQGAHEIVVDGEFEQIAIFYSRVLAVPIPAARSSHDRSPGSDHPSPVAGR